MFVAAHELQSNQQRPRPAWTKRCVNSQVTQNSIDILQHIDGVGFDEAWEKRVEATVDGIPAHVISAEHLVQNKLKSGRLQDLADVEAIREADKAEEEKHE